MLKEIIKKYKTFLIYGIISIFVTVIDVTVTYISKIFISLIIANSIGIISGAIIQYILNAKLVFYVKEKSTKNLIIYITTFIFGLVIANAIIYYSDLLFVNYIQLEQLRFLVTKGLSIVLPFFILYFLRRKLYSLVKEENR